MTNRTYSSVIIPLYNKEKYIKRSVHSVLAQTHQSFELIIVNDGSTDSSLARVKEIEDERIRIIDRNNLGVSEARNRGIEEAKHDLIAFLDADDQWEPECLENLVRAAEKFPDAKMIGVAHKIISPEGEMTYPEFKYVPEKVGIIENYFKAALERNPICASSVIICKEVFDKIGGFTVGMQYGEDSFMWAKIALNYKVAFINEYLTIIYKNSGDKASSHYTLTNDFPLLEYISSMDKEIEEEDYYIKEYTYKIFLNMAKRCLQTGDKSKARQFISKAKTTKLSRLKYIKRKKDLYLSHLIIKRLADIWRKVKNLKIKGFS